MSASNRRWNAAAVEHLEVLREFRATATSFAGPEWHCAPAPDRWSAAETVLHVCLSYEFGRMAAAGAAMRLLVPSGVAWLSRNLLLPIVLATKRFPRGASAPAEVRPDTAEAARSTPDFLLTRLDHAAEEAAEALRQAASRRPVVRVRHAYFGDLSPLTAFRLLSAHTRHHAALLARPAAR